MTDEQLINWNSRFKKSKKIMKNNQKKIEGITIEIPENER